MFSALSNIASFLWKSSDENYEEESFDTENEEDILDKYKYGDNEIYEEENMETNTFFGTITSINHIEKYGLINKDVYFDFKVVIGDMQLKKGDYVTGTSVRYSKDQNWVAVSVFLSTECWESGISEKTGSTSKIKSLETELKEKKAVTTNITYMNKDKLIFNHILEVSANKITKEYSAKQGDWIKIELVDDEKYNIHPLRKLEISEGKITRLIRSGCGIIDHKIFFTKDVCLNDFIPKRGDLVDVEAVESNQMNFEWRAISVKKVEMRG
ncbi:RNA helicase Mov10l1-like [Centruroides sculpturatus]|uniref:RNA helicase Mov10l1-like n=1 Tax=Centruroides sculpturatus TaxID=218467 RepID=UPI000C6E62F8|nr:RNA helicase Mov10l1-like [Centruroides sculpturatus]